MNREPESPAVSAMLRATAHSINGMIAALSESFVDDPGLRWIWPDREDRILRLPHFFDAIVHGTMANGIAFHSPSHDAASLWRTPRRTHPDEVETLVRSPSLMAAFSVGRERSQRMSATLKAHQPTDYPWWYLQFIGVRPSAQGTGLGGAILRAGLDLARSDAMPVYVEVMNPANLAYYGHAGFETIREFDIPDGGPHVWAMIR